MKLKIKSIAIICVVTLIGCNNKHIQSINKKAETINEEVQVVKVVKDSSEKKLKDAVDKMTHDQLYSEGETRRDTSSKLEADPSTMKKIYTEAMGDDTCVMTLRYQKNIIISVVNRITNKFNIKLYNTVFYFSKNNECISVNYWNNKDRMTYTYDMYCGTLIEYDGNYNRIELDNFQKLQIIQSTKLSLDSIMQHFPEFKYSFNWK